MRKLPTAEAPNKDEQFRRRRKCIAYYLQAKLGAWDRILKLVHSKMKRTVAFMIATLAFLGMASAQQEHLENMTSTRTFTYEPAKCQSYADEYDVVAIHDYENTKCYELLDTGKYAKLGIVCLTIEEYEGKTCIKFVFKAVEGYKFTKIYAGADANCAIPKKDPFQVKKTGEFYEEAVYVCLDEFYALPGEDKSGCCNSDICTFVKVVASKKICDHYGVCHWEPKDYWGFPAAEGGCTRGPYDWYTSCSVPLLCKNLPPPPKEYPCVDYVDKYHKYAIGNYRNRKCYALTVGGTKSTKIGILCVSTREWRGKKCIRFYYVALPGYSIAGVQAGASDNCDAATGAKYQATRRSKNGQRDIVLYVCLDSFDSPPGLKHEGCCNKDICFFARALFWKKLYNPHGYGHAPRRKRLLVYPKISDRGCSYYEHAPDVRCSIPLFCKWPIHGY